MNTIDEIRITSLSQIDELIARSQGFTEAEWDEECSSVTPGARWNYGPDYYSVTIKALMPPDVDPDEDWLYEHGAWVYENGGAPFYSSCWEDTELLIMEIEDKGYWLEIQRYKEDCSCGIYSKTAPSSFSVAYTGANHGIPKSMPLAVCFAWLHHLGYRPILELDCDSRVGSKPGKTRTLITPQLCTYANSPSKKGPGFTRLNETEKVNE